MLHNLIKNILHSDLQRVENPDFIRANIFAKGLIITFFADFIYSIYFYFHNPTDYKNISNLIGITILIITILLLKFQPKLKVTFIFVVSCVFPLVAWGISFTGGIYSTNLIWLLVLAINVYIYVGRKAGIIFSGLCFCIYVLFLISAYFETYNQYCMQFLQSQDPVDGFFNISFSSLFCFVIIFAFVKNLDDVNKKIKKNNEEKVESLNLKIKEKTNEISALRSSLAKDFHDEMGNKLAGISVLSQMLAKKFNDKFDNETIAALETIQTRSNELLLGTKDFIWSIDVKSDYVTHLGLFIRNFSEDFFSKLNISFSYQSEISEDSTLRVNVSSGRQIVNIFKEAMTNVAKHAEATEVSFVISINKNTIVFTMKDNGKGFEIEKVNKNGIFNMKDRAEQIKSNISIVSEHNKGTRIELHVPLEN